MSVILGLQCLSPTSLGMWPARSADVIQFTAKLTFASDRVIKGAHELARRIPNTHPCCTRQAFRIYNPEH